MRATPSAVGSRPSDASIRSAGPRSARPPTMPLTATMGVPVPAAAASASRTPGRARIGPGRHDRVRRGDDDDVGRLDRCRHLGSDAGRLDPAEADLEDLGSLPAMDEVLLELEPAVWRADLGANLRRRSSAGSWPGRRATPRGRVPRRSAAPRGRAARCARGAWQGRGRRGGTRRPRLAPRACRSRSSSRPRSPQPRSSSSRPASV